MCIRDSTRVKIDSPSESSSRTVRDFLVSGGQHSMAIVSAEDGTEGTLVLAGAADDTAELVTVSLAEADAPLLSTALLTENDSSSSATHIQVVSQEQKLA